MVTSIQLFLLSDLYATDALAMARCFGPDHISKRYLAQSVKYRARAAIQAKKEASK